MTIFIEASLKFLDDPRQSGNLFGLRGIHCPKFFVYPTKFRDFGLQLQDESFQHGVRDRADGRLCRSVHVTRNAGETEKIPKTRNNLQPSLMQTIGRLRHG